MVWIRVLCVLACLVCFPRAADATITYVYDRLGRLTGVIDPAQVTTIFRYHSVGNITDMDSESVETLSWHAVDLYWAGRHEEALSLCLSLAESSQAPPWILTLVGRMYFLGHGTKTDREEGLRWYRRAADADEPRALTFLSGLEQEVGRHAEAKDMLEQAAAQGYMGAVMQLGYLYDHGLGVPRDPKRARRYFERAAEQGYVFAKRFIAGQLLRGDDGLLGIPRGVLMFVGGLVEGVRIRIKNPHSDKGRR